MKKRKIAKKIICTAMALSMALFSSGAVFAEDQSEENLTQAASMMREQGKVQLNFKDLEVTKFIRFMSELLGENIVVTPGVKGTVSVVSPKSLSLKEAREIMLSVLEMNNLTTQQRDGYTKVIPMTNSKEDEMDMVVKGDMSIAPGESDVVQMVPLRFVKAAYVIPPLKAAIPQVQATPVAVGNAILISGKASLLNKAAAIIRAIDANDSICAIKIFPLKYANPKLLETQLNTLAKDAASKLAGATAVGDERTKSIIVAGSSQALRETDRILKSLDVKSRTEDFHVYKLKHADAKTVAEQLSQILAVAAKLNPDAKGAKPSTVVPDLPTNSLIFTVNQEQYNSLRTILDQLDTQPRQVLLRGMIAEVSLNKLKSAGIDWAAWGGQLAGSMVLAGNAQLGGATIPSGIQDLYQSLVTKDTYHETVSGTGYTTTETVGAGLAYAYVKLLNQFNAINVLSMPRLMCTDNLQSSLQVGQVIPILKGSLTNQTNTNSVTNSYDYKDVGLILTVTPHIRSGNLVALEIEQRIEELQTTTNANTPITSKREVKTTVLVANGDTIVIGGLIKEAEKELKNRVPLFSYIPLVGQLFRSKEKQREKVDLMIFLTPTILETPQHAAEMTGSVIKDVQKVSEAEKMMLRRNAESYKKSVKKEAVSIDTLERVKNKAAEKKMVMEEIENDASNTGTTEKPEAFSEEAKPESNEAEQKRASLFSGGDAPSDTVSVVVKENPDNVGK